MYIHEAIKVISQEAGMCITRRIWNELHLRKGVQGPSAKLKLTASPDNIIYVSVVEPHYRPNWSPTLADLVADDWAVCN